MGMADKVHDRMVERTRRLIKETLLLLIEEKGFGNVTVRDLTHRAKINRGTFYLHYLDKFDLLESVESGLLDGLQQHMRALDYQEMMDSHKQNKPHAPLVDVFRYLKQNGPILRALLGAKGDPAFSPRLKESLKNGIFKEINDHFQDISIPSEYFSAFATSAYLGVIEDWLNSGMRQSPEEMAVIYVKIKFFAIKP